MKKKLYKSSDKKITGALGGLAEYFDVDATLVRVGYVLLTVATGVGPGIVGYFVLAIIMDEKPDA